MEFKLNGRTIEIDPDAAGSRLRNHPSEPIRVHWVELDGGHWPPKQALEVITGIQRSEYTTHRACDILSRVGFTTSRDSARARAKSQIAPMSPPLLGAPSREVLHAAVDALADFMDGTPLTQRVADLEAALLNATGTQTTTIANNAEVDLDTLRAALTVRSSFGRINDVIHALVITSALPRILDADERVTVRPSLAAGNDPSRQFDLETNKRVAEFKVSGWTGADAMRKRGIFADLVHVVMDRTERAKYLYVLGSQPRHFLETTTSSAAWGFTRKSALLRERFEEQYGSADDISISAFFRNHGANVNIIDVLDVLPELQSVLQPASGAGVP